MISFSIIIVTYNSADVIIPCLKSFQSWKEVEIIIVDNGSTDETTKLIRQEFSRVLIIENKSNIGFAAAANQGFDESTGEFAIFLNPDATLPDNFPIRLAEYLKLNPMASIIGCRLVDEDGKKYPSCWKKPNLLTLFIETFLPYKLSLRFVTELPDVTKEVEMVSGACILVRRDVFQMLGGFDERFFMYYEDADFCLRARQKGQHIFYFPDIEVYHQIGEAPNSYKEKFFNQYYTSKLLFYRKHYPGIRSTIAFFEIITGVVIRIPVYAVVGVLFAKNNFLQLSKYHLRVLRMIFGRK